MPILDSQNVKMAAESQDENVEDEFGWQRHQRPPASVFPGVADKRKHWLVSDILENVAFWKMVRRTMVKHQLTQLLTMHFPTEKQLEMDVFKQLPFNDKSFIRLVEGPSR